MRFGLTLCNHGEYADPRLLSDLAVEAEAAGWDGVFVWDHIARDGEPAMTDPWIAMAAIAARTGRVALGPMVTPLARRRPWKLARETTALDHLSGGRLVLGVGLGVHAEEFEMLGDEGSPRARAALLDEGLDVVTALWTGERVDHRGAAYTVDAVFTPQPVQTRIPIWVAGTWPKPAPFRRAARYDGSFPIGVDGTLSPQDHRDIRSFVEAERDGGPLAGREFTLVHQGDGQPGDIHRWPEYAEAGVDWWLESFRDGTRPVAEARAVIAEGPPDA